MRRHKTESISVDAGGLALIGVGPWGKNIYRVLEQMGCLSAIISSRTRRLVEGELGHNIACELFSSPAQAFSNPSVRAVVIASPPATHVKLTLQGLASGKAVFVEKPLSLNSEDARAIAAAASNANLPVFVGHIFHYHPAWPKILEALAGDLVTNVEMRWDREGPFHEDLLWSFGTHEVGMILAIFGKMPSRVEVQNWGHTGRRLDALTVALEFGPGRRAVFALNRRSKRKSKNVRISTAGGQLLEWANDELYSWSRECMQMRPVPLAKVEPLEVELMAFLNVLNGSERPAVGPLEAYRVAQTLEMIQEAASIKSG